MFIQSTTSLPTNSEAVVFHKSITSNKISLTHANSVVLEPCVGDIPQPSYPNIITPVTYPWTYPPRPVEITPGWPGLGSTITITGQTSFSPWRVSVVGDTLTVSADVPGVKSEDVSIVIEDNKIKVFGRRHDTGTRVSLEYSLTNDWDHKTSYATLEAGVVTVTVKKHVDKQVHVVPLTSR